MAGLLDYNFDSENKGALGNMTPQQMGLLQAGLAMLGAPKYAPIGNGLVRSTSFGEQVAPGVAQGIQSMQDAQQLQQQNKLSNLQALQSFVKAKSENDQYEKQNKLTENLAKIKDPGDKASIAKLYMDAGDAKTAIEILKQNRDGIPTGYLENDKGQLYPRQLVNGGNFEDVLLNRAIAQQQGKASVIDPIEQARLNIAIQGNKRAEEDQSIQREKLSRDSNIQEKTANQKDFELLNPNYKKNQEDILNAETDLEKLKNATKAYLDLIDKNNNVSRHNPFTNGDIQTAYQAATWPLRGESMINTGVLNTGDMKALNAAMQDPTAFNLKGFRNNEDIKKQIDQILLSAENNVKAIKSKKAPVGELPFRNKQDGIPASNEFENNLKLPKNPNLGDKYNGLVFTMKGWTKDESKQDNSGVTVIHYDSQGNRIK